MVGSPVATGPIFPAPLLASATPSTYTSGNTYFTYSKDVHAPGIAEEVKQEVSTSVPASAGQNSEVDRRNDSLESRPIDSETLSSPVVLQPSRKIQILEGTFSGEVLAFRLVEACMHV